MIASSRSGKGRLLFYCRAAPTGKLTLPQSTRSGQDRSLRTAAHGCLVGRGLDPSGQPVSAARPLQKAFLHAKTGPAFRQVPFWLVEENNKKMACLSPHYTILRDLWTPVLRNSTHSAMFTAWSPRRSRYLSIINKSSAVSASLGWAAM